MEGKDQRKSMRSKLRIKAFMWILCMLLGCCMWLQTGVESYAAATADVLAQEGRIRESADKTSKTVASVKKGDKLDVLAETKDGDGYTWYKVRINSQENGYIRADLVNISGTVPTQKADTAASTDSSSEQNSDSTQNQSQETVVEVTVSETDVVSVKSIKQAKIRKGAGTNFDSAGGMKEGITVPVSGIATGSDGKNWYQISYSENNNTITGFIREDLVEVVERKEIVEEAPVEEVQPVVEEVTPTVENQDYYLKYMDNGNGEMDWFLFDNIEGTSMSLTQILSVIDQVKNKELKDDQDLVTMKMVVIVLAVVVVVLVVAVTILIFKLRDSYIYDDYDEDEEEEEEEEEKEKEKAPIKEPKRIFPVRTKKEEAPAAPIIKEETQKPSEKIGEEIPPVKTSQSENTAWQSKDFLELDDDMEFEFLDL